jgi:hypothetical protein
MNEAERRGHWKKFWRLYFEQAVRSLNKLAAHI